MSNISISSSEDDSRFLLKMNRNAKTRPIAKRLRSSTKTIAKAPRPRSALMYREDSNSDEEFDQRPCQKIVKNKKKQTLKKSTAIEGSQSKASAGSRPSSSYKKKNVGGSSTCVYEISDSSDDELILLNNSTTTTNSNIVNIDLSESDNALDPIACVNKKMEALKNKENPSNYSQPSTSTHLENTDDMLMHGMFIDSLLDRDDSDICCLKSIKQLHEETDELLARSSQLINDIPAPLNDSVIYVCSQDPATKLVNTDISQKHTEEAGVVQIADTDTTNKKSETGQLMKPSCPICLDTLGDTPVSVTVCGHAFCTTCIKNCIKSQRMCPTCRKRLTTKMIHPLFLY